MKNTSQIPRPQRSPTEDREYRLKAAGKIIKLCEPVKELSTGRLFTLKSVQLDRIGRAARELYDVLAEAGLLRR